MRFTRRNFIKVAGAAGLTLSTAPVFSLGNSPRGIDRQALVRRHNPVVTQFDPFSALTVGNGEFAFTADITGLQTFSAEAEKIFPLCTTAHWSWHSNARARRQSGAKIFATRISTLTAAGSATPPTGRDRNNCSIGSAKIRIACILAGSALN